MAVGSPSSPAFRADGDAADIGDCRADATRRYRHGRYRKNGSMSPMPAHLAAAREIEAALAPVNALPLATDATRRVKKPAYIGTVHFAATVS